MIVNVKNVCEDYNGYRSARVKSLFNPTSGNVFEASADIPFESIEWQIGLIVGPSGSGKTSIGKAVFPGVGITDLYAGWPGGVPIIEAISPDGEFNDVTSALANVGLGDVPAWLRPFSALSNGQQFRAGLARLICDAPEVAIIDEFTSVIDRQIAKIGALAFAKGWRRGVGKVVLLACHYDIAEWLQPDWVYDTGTGEFKKKIQSRPDQNSQWKLGRSTPVTGNILNLITI